MNIGDTVDKAKDILTIREYKNNLLGDISEYWSEYLDKNITASDVAALMILLKVARIKNDPRKVDSWVDVAGYADLGAYWSTDD